MDRITVALALGVAALVTTLVAGACSDGGEATLTIYSGRSEDLVGPLIEDFERQTSIDVEVRYASSTDLAATLREEGSNSPADVFYAQDPASLGAVAIDGLFMVLPEDILSMVPDRFSDRDGLWVGTSGRSRVVVYDSTRVEPGDIPTSVDGFIDPEWSGRLGIAPGNGSFLAFVAAMILERGETATLQWLEGIAANDPKPFSGNSPIVAAVDDNQVEAGLANHYYLLRLQAEQGETDAANFFFPTTGPGSLVMPAGVGVLATTDKEAAALRFVEFLLSNEAQQYFVDETYEYPVIEGVDPDPALPPISSLQQPDIDLSALAETIDAATDLVARAGLL